MNNRSIFVVVVCILGFFTGCQTPKPQMTGFWVKCSEIEATHALSVHCVIQDQYPLSYTWFLKRGRGAKSPATSVNITANTLQLNLPPAAIVQLKGDFPGSKCDATFSLNEPKAEFPADPFLLNVYLNWQTQGRSDQFAKIIEVHGPLTTEFPEKKLKLTVSLTEFRQL